MPTISDDNFPLKRVVFQKIEDLLPEEFKKNIFAGNNLYSCMANYNNKDMSYFEYSATVKNENYKVKLNKVKTIDFTEINNNGEKENQEIKHIIEKLIRFIIMRDPRVIRFRDGTIVNVNDLNVQSINDDNNNNNNEKSVEKIYKGYTTSVQITDNGFFMRINDVNKILSTKTAHKKIMEIRNNNKEKGILQIRDLINNYFSSHRTVLTKYGNLRAYKINAINYDKNPKNTSVNLKDINGNINSVPLINYYRNQYGIKILDETQPLIEVERTIKKADKSDTEIIYLIPELVFLTGLEENNVENDNTTRRKITSKTKMKPFDKIKAIQSINELINSTVNKKFKNKEGKEIVVKSAKEIKDLYGISIGNNLTIKGRIIPQPHLIFNNGQKFIIPNNGNFRSENPNKVIMFTNDNLFFVYDIKEKNDCLSIFSSLMVKCRTKKFLFSDNFNPKNIRGYPIKKNKWMGRNI